MKRIFRSLPIGCLTVGDLPTIHEAHVTFLHAKMVHADGAGIWKLNIIPFLHLGFLCNLLGFRVGEAGFEIHLMLVIVQLLFRQLGAWIQEPTLEVIAMTTLVSDAVFLLF